MTATSEKTLLQRVEDGLELVIFHSRWLLAAFYVVITIAIGYLAWDFSYKFIFDFFVDDHKETDRQLTSHLLGLVDTTLLANLLLIVVFNGYENFVSKIGASLGKEDRPRWMGDVDFAGLKLKLLGTMVAISAINLLEEFMKMADTDRPIGANDSGRLTWMMAIHAAFVITGVLFALTEKIGESHAARYGKKRVREVLLVSDGVADHEAITRAEVTPNEILAAIRSAGGSKIADVKYALLMTDGSILLETNSGGRTPIRGAALLPELSHSKHRA